VQVIVPDAADRLATPDKAVRIAADGGREAIRKPGAARLGEFDVTAPSG
jgi:hypothetical protein